MCMFNDTLVVFVLVPVQYISSSSIAALCDWGLCTERYKLEVHGIMDIGRLYARHGCAGFV